MRYAKGSTPLILQVSISDAMRPQAMAAGQFVFHGRPYLRIGIIGVATARVIGAASGHGVPRRGGEQGGAEACQGFAFSCIT